MSDFIKKIPRQPLRIPDSWIVICNQFYEMDPLSLKPDDEEIWTYCFDSTLLTIQHWGRPFLLDLSWVPVYKPSGHFVLQLVKKSDWDNPVVQLETRNKDEVVEKIESLLYEVNLGTYGKEEWKKRGRFPE